MTVFRWPCPTEFRVLSIEGPLQAPVSAALRHAVRRLIRRGERHIVLDLNQVSEIDAAGVGELVRAYNMARVAKGIVHVANPRAWVREAIARVGLLELLNTDGIAPIYGTAAGVWQPVSNVPDTTVDAMMPTITGAGVPCPTPMRFGLPRLVSPLRFPRVCGE